MARLNLLVRIDAKSGRSASHGPLAGRIARYFIPLSPCGRPDLKDLPLIRLPLAIQ